MVPIIMLTIEEIEQAIMDGNYIITKYSFGEGIGLPISVNRNGIVRTDFEIFHSNTKHSHLYTKDSTSYRIVKEIITPDVFYNWVFENSPIYEEAYYIQ